ncbi:unnamed protein product, partial [marine sediment metagenome]
GHLCEELGLGGRIPFDDMEIDLGRPWARRSFKELYEEHTGLALRDLDGARRRAAEKGLAIEGLSNWKIVHDLFEDAVEPLLVDPTFVTDFPKELILLAKTSPGDPEFVECFELYIGRMEIAPAYTELNDPDDQRERFVSQLARGGHEWGELDEDFLLSLEYGMPPAGGMGVGIDRLIMLLANRRSIRDVILFPLLRRKEQDPSRDDEDAG